MERRQRVDTDETSSKLARRGAEWVHPPALTEQDKPMGRSRVGIRAAVAGLPSNSPQRIARWHLEHLPRLGSRATPCADHCFRGYCVEPVASVEREDAGEWTRKAKAL
eukprot:scaffold1213_cov256-Pinguiococcus_pyrenoidosus.AAC.11